MVGSTNRTLKMFTPTVARKRPSTKGTIAVRQRKSIDMACVIYECRMARRNGEPNTPPRSPSMVSSDSEFELDEIVGGAPNLDLPVVEEVKSRNHTSNSEEEQGDCIVVNVTRRTPEMTTHAKNRNRKRSAPASPEQDITSRAPEMSTHTINENGKRIAPASPEEEQVSKKRKNNFLDMVFDEETKDFSFVVNGTIVKAHRAVLRASSTMFSGNNNTIELTVFDLLAVRWFVVHLYGVNAFERNLELKFWLHLTTLFRKFRMKDAMVKAAQHCIDRCTSDNIMEVYKTVNQVEQVHEQLVEKVIQYIRHVDVSLLKPVFSRKILFSGAIGKEVLASLILKMSDKL